VAEEMILITLREYEDLIGSRDFLEALEQAGVDNWVGYDVAHEIMWGNEDYS